jgi:AcrR family transcriptional regulator
MSSGGAGTAPKRTFDAPASNPFDVWSRADSSSRKPRFSRAEIATAAVRIADAEGVDALSMRRIAAELDAGTMTLYHYVRDKGELLTLMTDEVMGEMIVPTTELPVAWRQAMSVIAHRAHAALMRHPWMFDVFDHPGFGPNGIRHFEQCLTVLADFPGALPARMEVIGCVDEFVFGFVIMNRFDELHLTDGAGMQYVQALVAAGGYPMIAGLVEEFGADGMWSVLEKVQSDPNRFTRSLNALLDGIELRAEASRARPAPRRGTQRRT